MRLLTHAVAMHGCNLSRLRCATPFLSYAMLTLVFCRYISPLLHVVLAVTALAGVVRVDAAEVDVTPLSAAVQQGKITAATWRRVEAGEQRDLLVLFGDPAIESEMQAHRTRRTILTEDGEALALRAGRYRLLKAPALASFARDEAEVRKDYQHIPMAHIRFKKLAALQRLLARNEVLAITEDIRYLPVLSQSLPLIRQPPVAQVIGRSGAGSTVAVIDTGINYTLSEFGSCTAPGVPSGCRVVAALDMAPSDAALDDIGHGTEVSGVIAATSPGTRLAVLDVFNGGGANATDIISAFDWVIANRAAYNIVAINLSLSDSSNNTVPCSSFFSNPLRQPINSALNAGILTVAASGNDGFTNGLASPACTPGAVSVGAVYDDDVGAAAYGTCSDAATVADKVTCFSDSASFLTLLAPGALITTTGATVAGTSLAAPFVSAAVAVMAGAFPTDTPSQRLARLTSTGKPVTDSRNGITKPRLDLLAAQGPPANNTFTAAVTLTGNAGQTTGWNYNATAQSGEPVHAATGGGKSVWWQWTAATSGTVTVDTHGSDFDSVLAVYTGAAVNALTSIASNDNDGAVGSVSGLSFHADAGITYRIAVDGNTAESGAIVLNRSFSADPPPAADVGITLTDTPDPVAAGGTLGYTVTVTNLAAVAAQNVIASITLPPGATLVSAAGCTQLSGVVACSLGTLAEGQQITRTIQITPLAAGTIQGQASVSSTTPDANSANNTAIAVTTVTLAGGGEGDVPLPAWALVLLGSALWGGMRWRLSAPMRGSD